MRPMVRILPGGLVTLVLVAASACQPAPREAAPDVEAIRAAIEEVNAAGEALFASRDVAALADRIYTADATILPPGAAAISGRDAIADFWSGALEEMAVTGVDLSTDQLVPLSSTSAYEIGHAVIETEGGSAVSNYVVIWQRGDDGAWRWRVDIWNAAPSGG